VSSVFFIFHNARFLSDCPHSGSKSEPDSDRVIIKAQQAQRYLPVATLETGHTSYRGGPQTLSKFSRPTRRVSLVLALVITISLLLVLFSRARHNMSSESHLPEDPHLTKSSLSMVLSQTDSSRPSVRVTLTNYHPSTSVTVLIWSTPFDPQAVPLGIFRVTDRSTKQDVPMLGIKINRLLPPSREDFLELAPRHAVTKNVYLEAPGLALEKGKTYDVQAHGKWKAVWHASLKAIGEVNLMKMGGPTGLVSWDFESDVIQLEVR
jgi:hypothetical protein